MKSEILATNLGGFATNLGSKYNNCARKIRNSRKDGKSGKMKSTA